MIESLYEVQEWREGVSCVILESSRIRAEETWGDI
jgi:hypothetical protein